MNTQFQRRIQDGVAYKKSAHRMNLGRRFIANERRDLNYNYNYNGPARRFIIDRRLKISDRRCIEDSR
jgi:hypothetical protein